MVSRLKIFRGNAIASLIREPVPRTACRRRTSLRSFHSGKSTQEGITIEQYRVPNAETKKSLPPLSLLPTNLLLRSLLISSILASPRLLRPCLKVVGYMVNSRSAFLNPDKNPVLHAVLGPAFRHFASGENEAQVKKTIAAMKKIGFKGVILGYSKEIVVDSRSFKDEASKSSSNTPDEERIIEEWKRGTLRTLAMIDEGDYLAVKMTGAGPVVTEALALKQDPPPAFLQAMNEISEETIRKGSRLWIDAEQQVFQDTIDRWTAGLMQRYNRDGNVPIYTTFQAYLKKTPENIRKYLAMAKEGGYAVGVKLVRGAYIAAERRELIHDTKEDTDAAYNMIVANLLSKSCPGLPTGDQFPEVRLFLASHNHESVKRGAALHRSRILAQEATIPLEFGQLQGMADDVSCSLLQLSNSAKSAEGHQAALERLAAPKGYKCLTWGTTKECLGFLLRRAVENMGALERTKQTVADLRTELWRRMFRSS